MRRYRLRWVLAGVLLLTVAAWVRFAHTGVLAYLIFKPVIVDAFHIVYYHSSRSTWDNTFWFGTRVQKNPLDLWVFQEIIFETRPNVIVEAGTFMGGSALYMAQMLDLLGRGQVVTIDIEDHSGKPMHPRIRYLLGSSTSTEITEKVKSYVTPQDRVMVVLDSNHHKAHVLQELRLYHGLVTKGNYLIVEDTNINGHPVDRSFGPGPMEAVEEFLQGNADFLPDRTREKFLVTHNPKGYLRRIR